MGRLGPAGGGNAFRSDGNAGAGTLSIPLAGGSRPFEIDATGGTALGGVLDWRGELATIATLLPLPGHELGGDMVIAVTLGGMLGQPTIEGELA